MKGMMPVRGYARQETSNHETDFKDLLKSISPLTKIGAVCFVIGKLTGVLAIPAVFIPSLNAFAIPLIICWGTLILATIVICSVDHFVVKKRQLGSEQAKAEEVQSWLADHPELREQILAELQQAAQSDTPENDKVISMSSYR
ncbi:MAG: hypothetical protein JXO49_00740 [Deltaproteobacteria bacterium]|nr:hypothetical protein [Candidatus Anaeroferrophillus wilburensis]MBN2887852.1 hypothetical protein [Deltaproteobacteria bacterium]